MYFSKSPGGYSYIYFYFSPGVYIYIIGLFVLWEISRHTVIYIIMVIVFLDIYEFAKI